MGQKVHPTGIRLGIAKDWNSTWYADKGDYAENLKSDLEVREYLMDRLSQAAVSRIQIERPAKSARITIHTARPGIVIGKKGEDIERLRRDVSRFKNMHARFSKHVFPGETLITNMWQDTPERIIFQTKVAERDEIVLSNAAIELHPK